VNDCGDGSDEKNCPTTTPATTTKGNPTGTERKTTLFWTFLNVIKLINAVPTFCASW